MESLERGLKITLKREEEKECYGIPVYIFDEVNQEKMMIKWNSKVRKEWTKERNKSEIQTTANGSSS